MTLERPDIETLQSVVDEFRALAIRMQPVNPDAATVLKSSADIIESNCDLIQVMWQLIEVSVEQ